MTALDAIKAVLSDEVRELQSLIGLLQHEKACLIELNARQLSDLAKEKDTVILRLKLLEHERIRLMTGLFAEEGGGQDMNLLRLSERTGDERLSDMRTKMVSLLQAVMELNGFNRLITERSLNKTRAALRVLGQPDSSVVGSWKGMTVSKEI